MKALSVKERERNTPLMNEKKSSENRIKGVEDKPSSLKVMEDKKSLTSELMTEELQ